MSVLEFGGLFAMACPSCDVQLAIDAQGNGRCPRCHHTYAPRFGLLVPLDEDAQAGQAGAVEP